MQRRAVGRRAEAENGAAAPGLPQAAAEVGTGCFQDSAAAAGGDGRATMEPRTVGSSPGWGGGMGSAGLPWPRKALCGGDM